ncbi:MAG: DnaJ domain-containing protein [candidate division Zixibacteria bacterium]|nr:DnaJ domain-containing protein [candidate division Zixibacteria bacterium]
MIDYYQILGCEYGTEIAALKSAYREIAKTSHPDHGGNEEKFVLLQKAYSTLTDQEKKNSYDQKLGLRQFKEKTYRITSHAEIVRPSRDIFDDIVDVVKGKFGSTTGGKITVDVKAGSVVKNNDEVVLLAPEFEIVCPKCIGFGGWMGNCPICRGEGRILKEFLIPFELEGELAVGDSFNFEYKRFQVHVRII